ncbi:MAG: hypothetical protein JSV76_01140 [Candidatus Bathyarchaeota archaeon]|nr:MAG: hypothetical protein JSV76_01140 [Candidatus Bathyarchaeota archaeon]
MYTFSHQFPNIHVPKELEYLKRFLAYVPQDLQIDFLRRFTEYLTWAPKYRHNASASSISGHETPQDITTAFKVAMEHHKGLAALFYINQAAEDDLQKTLRMVLRIGSIDVSQSLGHYFSCTESVIKLANRVGLPAARNHLFLLTMYLMQSSPFNVTTFKKPNASIDTILSELVKKGGFYEYHYMILMNGLINQREYIGEHWFQHALATLEELIPDMTETLTIETLNSMIHGRTTTNHLLHELQRSIWKGKLSNAYAVLRTYLEEFGITTDLRSALTYKFTMIDDHPHDPHYVTFPISAFELTRHLNHENAELLLAHVVEFAVERVNQLGTMEIDRSLGNI